MKTIDEFCNHHKACDEGRAWALSNCRTMQEAWETARHEWLIWIATRPSVASDAQLRKFAVLCARRIQHLMRDPRSIAALDVAERHADGMATDEELLDARRSAQAAEGDAERVATEASRTSARDSAWTAARAAEWAAADAARDAALSAQDAWLRKNITPNFL